MYKETFFVRLSLILSFFVGMKMEAQTTFDPPSRPVDYSSYLYIEDCVAGATRISTLPKIQSAVVDTFLAVRKAKYRSISKVAKDTGQICANRWLTGLRSLSDKEFVKEWVGFFVFLGEKTEARKRYSRYIDSLPAEEKLGAKGALAALFYGHLDSLGVDEWLELSADYFNAIPSDSFPLVASSYAAKVVNWVTLWEPEKADTALNLYLDFLDSLPVDKRNHPLIVNLIAPRFFETAILVKEPEAMLSLVKSTSDYSEYLKELWRKVGNVPRVIPVDSLIPRIKGKWWYAPKGKSASNFIATGFSADSADTRRHGKVNAIAFIEPGCHSSSPKSGRSNQWARQNAEQGECLGSLVVLNRLKETYPEIQLTIVSRTFGSFGSTLSESPQAEAETIAKYIIEHFKVNAYVAIEESEFFTMPGLDKRRVDLPTENDANFTIANSRLSRNGNVVLFDSEGKIFYSGSIAGENEVSVRNMVDAVMKRTKSPVAQQ